jgi:GrpB-like predicted nucleotidyltransferase (UPF0157 family)
MKGQKNRIVVVDYDPAWATTYQEMAAIYRKYLGDLIVDVQHVGSTSVPGLAAKPILDIDLIIQRRSQLPEVIASLEKLGYWHSGDLGVPGREVFKRERADVPRDGSEREWPRHNLYVCLQGHVSLRNHLTLRNYLHHHPGAVQAYGALKKQLAQQYPYDIDAYIEGKTPFITEILQKEGFSDSEIAGISKLNQIDPKAK